MAEAITVVGVLAGLATVSAIGWKAAVHGDRLFHTISQTIDHALTMQLPARNATGPKRVKYENFAFSLRTRRGKLGELTSWTWTYYWLMNIALALSLAIFYAAAGPGASSLFQEPFDATTTLFPAAAAIFFGGIVRNVYKLERQRAAIVAQSLQPGQLNLPPIRSL